MGDQKLVTEFIEFKRKESSVNLTKPYIVRLCGYNYHLFRQGLLQPFDPNFQSAMVCTMDDLLLAFQPRTGHTHAFEIVLIFDGSIKTVTSSTTKLICLYSSYATTRFNYHMAKYIATQALVDLYHSAKILSVCNKQSIFYGEYYQPSLNYSVEIQQAKFLNYLISRCRDKTLGAAIYVYAQTLLPSRLFKTKKCEYYGCQELLALLEQYCGIRWAEHVSLFISYGVFSKLYINEDGLQSKERFGIQFRRPSMRTFILDETPQMYEVLMSLHWPAQMKGERVTLQSFYQVNVFQKASDTEPESPRFFECTGQNGQNGETYTRREGETYIRQEGEL